MKCQISVFKCFMSPPLHAPVAGCNLATAFPRLGLGIYLNFLLCTGKVSVSDWGTFLHVCFTFHYLFQTKSRLFWISRLMPIHVCFGFFSAEALLVQKKILNNNVLLWPVLLKGRSELVDKVFNEERGNSSESICLYICTHPKYCMQWNHRSRDTKAVCLSK